MIIYKTTETNPYFNLASEQYLLDNIRDDIFMLWRNAPAVIIGRNQNAYSEINIGFTERHGIKVVRRLTGGGAVFHDLGNINFTFITEEDGGSLNFRRFCEPVIAALNKLGANAEMSGRNDITICGKKISGNAQCVRGGRFMHHGTLLYSADLSRLSGALNVDEEKIKSKGIKSVRSRVANIKDCIETDMDAGGFKEYLEGCFEGEIREFSPEDIKGIQTLADEVYSTWEWNFGQSKEYDRTNKKYFEFGLVEIRVNVKNGVIDELDISGDFFGRCDVWELEDTLTGIRYERPAVMAALNKSGEGKTVSDYIMGATAEEIAPLII